LELIANHDSAIQNHLDTVKKHQQHGERMQAHYLSRQSQNKFIILCAKKVFTEILSEIEKSYYYSLIVDGTPNVLQNRATHFAIRYTVLKNGIWELKWWKRFLKVQDSV
jgi:hypothetical protein